MSDAVELWDSVGAGGQSLCAGAEERWAWGVLCAEVELEASEGDTRRSKGRGARTRPRLPSEGNARLLGGAGAGWGVGGAGPGALPAAPRPQGLAFSPPCARLPPPASFPSSPAPPPQPSPRCPGRPWPLSRRPLPPGLARSGCCAPPALCTRGPFSAGTARSDEQMRLTSFFPL